MVAHLSKKSYCKTRGDKMFNRTNSVAAKLFLVENEDIPDATHTNEQIQEYKNRAEKIISATEDFMMYSGEEIEEKIMFELYEIGKRIYGTDKKSLFNFFRDFYLLHFSTKNGPRIGTFIVIFGLDNFKNKMYTNLNNPLGF